MDQNDSWREQFPALVKILRLQRDIETERKNVEAIINMEWSTTAVLEADELAALERTVNNYHDLLLDLGDARTDHIMERAQLIGDEHTAYNELLRNERIDITDTRPQAYRDIKAASFQIKKHKEQRELAREQEYLQHQEEMNRQQKILEAQRIAREEIMRQQFDDQLQYERTLKEQSSIINEERRHRLEMETNCTQRQPNHEMESNSESTQWQDRQMENAHSSLQTQVNSMAEQINQMMNIMRRSQAPETRSNAEESNRSVDLNSFRRETHTYQYPQPTAGSVTIIQRQPLRIPTFDGEPENFKSYWTRFNTLIHNEPSLSIAEKINMLYEGLSGKAKRLVNVDPTEENYEYIRKLMEKEYGTHKADLYKFIQELHAVRTAPYRAKECEKTLREIKGLLRRIETAGSPITKELVIGAVLPKFPFKLVKRLVMTAEELSVDKILDDLHDKVTEFKLQDEREVIHNRSNFYEHNATSSQRKQTNIAEQCAFCLRRFHSAEECRKYSTPEERRTIVKERNLCWICFSSKHNSLNCAKPTCSNCQMKHNKLLCIQGQTKSNDWQANRSRKPLDKKSTWPSTAPNDQRRLNDRAIPGGKRPTDRKDATQLLAHTNQADSHPSTEEDEQSTDSSSSTDDERVILHNKDLKQKKRRNRIILKTAEVAVLNHANQEYTKLNVIIDEGSTGSMITEEVAKTLNLPVKTSTTRTFYGIGGHKETHDTNEVILNLKTAEGHTKIIVATKPKLTVAVKGPILSMEDRKFIMDNGLRPASPYKNGEKVTPDVLIGLDNYAEITDRLSIEQIMPSGLLARNTKLGTIIFGSTTTKPRRTEEVALFASNATEERQISLEQIAQQLFELDNTGINANEVNEERITEAYFNDYATKIRYADKRIIAPFPRKDNFAELKDNKSVAIRRLHCLLTQLEKNSHQKEWYHRIMDDYIAQGVVERVPRFDNGNLKYYIPHHGVWKAEKPKPLRIVFDASSKAKGTPSLNDVINTGLIFTNKIHDILVANRFHKIIIMCDIEAAFTQIMLTTADRDLCRFFWIDPSEEGNRIVPYRFCRLPFGITSSPSILNMCLTHFLKSQNTQLAEEIRNLLYVDNITIGAHTEEEGIRKYLESKKLFKGISMNIREYISNNSIVNDAIPQEDKLEEHKVKMLGLPFNIRRDELTTQVNLELCEKLTKRIMLSQLHKSYDPVGMITPLLLKIKILLREVFNTKKGWDEQLDEETLNKWNLLVEAAAPAHVSIARYIPIKPASTLWIFADASMEATAVCSYIQTDMEVSDLLTGKVKLAPKRNLTIPKLELIAIRMAFNLAKNLVLKLKFHSLNVKIVSDSHIALDWISSSKKPPRTIEHYLKDIVANTQELSGLGNTVELYHVSTDHNPADIGTRGMDKEDCQSSSWIKGPQWINSPFNPLTPFSIRTRIESEEKTDDTILTQQVEEIDDQVTEACLKTENHRCNMAVATYIGKFLKAVTKHFKREPAYLKEFTASRSTTDQDYNGAKTLLIHLSQRMEDMKELEAKYRTWNFFRDQYGIIRIETRLQNADLPYDTRNPIWLPRKSQIAAYIIMQTHKKCGHQGRELVHTLIRQKYYLPKPMSTIKKVLQACQICKRFNTLPIGSPQMANLPKDRVTVTKPFLATGCDLMGPFTLQGEMKTHVCLFTCMATRAIHLELVPTASTESFLNALQRFTARRGVPDLIRSDNGSNFVLGNKILAQIVKERAQKLSAYSTFFHSYHLEKIKWIFNTPLAPWKGGAWERLIGIVKSAFNRAVGRYKPSLDEMHTIMSKIEVIVNSRPMTCSGSDDPEVIPIRPIDFLSTTIKFSIPDHTLRDDVDDVGKEPEYIASAQQAMEAIQFIANIADRFWYRWKTEYLTSIKDINKKTKNQGRHSGQTIGVGDVVIIKHEKAPRGSWQLGRITQMINSEDGLDRAAMVHTKGKVIERSLELLYPLELTTKPVAGSKNQDQLTLRAESPDSPEEVIPRQTSESNGTSRTDSQTQAESQTEPDGNPEINKQIQEDARPIPGMVKLTSLEAKPARIQAIMEAARRHLEKGKQQDETAPRKGCSLITVMTLIALASTWSSVAAVPGMICNNTHLTVNPDNQPLLLCIDSDCQNIAANINHPILINLKAVPGRHLAEVKLISELGTETTRCVRSQVCHKATFMSRNLLGNPHCWPLGAQLSAFTYITIITSLMCPLIRWIVNTAKNSQITHKARNGWNQSRAMIRNFKQLANTNQEAIAESPWRAELIDWGPPTRTYRQGPPIDEETVMPDYRQTNWVRSTPRSKERNLAQAKFMTLAIIMTIIGGMDGCQDTHTRYSIELKCDNRTHCYHQFGREVMFNSLTTKVCVQMMHNNVVIGSIEVEKVNSTLTCIKEHLHFSRITEPKVETRKRCRLSGSCNGNTCEDTTKESYIAEFDHTYQYQGESGCTLTCGGWLCGCGMVFTRGCSFYRLYHKPATEEIFDVFRCAEFKSEVTFKVNIIIKKQKTTEYFKLRPYQRIKTPFINATIVSVTNQYSPITSNRFARSDKRTIMIDNHDEFMLRCKTETDATSNQAACYLPDKCKCRPQEYNTTCECPGNAIRKHERKQSLPFLSSAMELREHGNTIVALQKTDEILFYMESNLLMDSAAMNLDYPCVPTFTNITGCYDCPEGAKIAISCMSTIDSWITIQCEDHIRSIECAPENPTTEITMYFTEATVIQQCFTKCANERRDFTISGTLLYHDLESDSTTAEQPDYNWTRLPDLNPLGSTITQRWKTSAALTGASFLATLISYAFGAQALTASSKPVIWLTFKATEVGYKILVALIKAIL